MLQRGRVDRDAHPVGPVNAGSGGGARRRSERTMTCVHDSGYGRLFASRLVDLLDELQVERDPHSIHQNNALVDQVLSRNLVLYKGMDSVERADVINGFV